MPQVKCITPKTLTDVCIEFVLKNIELWCKQTINDLQIIGPEIGDNPFDQLPCVILEQIVIKNRRHYRKDENLILQHLLTPQLTSVFVSDKELVQLASIRCPLMTNLTIINTNLNFFPKFEKLQELTLSMGRVEDSFLISIGTYCTHLRQLDLRCCPSVTDYGIQGLCVSVDNLGRNCVTLGRCKSLLALIIDRKTGVTKQGLKVALENMPALRILDHDATLEVLAEIAQNP
ncbi:hypothetical protein DAPPUDRAFT_338374 [Daphnia pulex]|uniref:Uncharacterized protein n=1 Tax=Daphnia pulex TaxID=6669 RepID=E9I2R6_DAPPU|nr:hypothetical protein DAPPUDRAFT_338374 [Daphnia pulex]|eukprot:EFX61714.1 hypothetical protein DAPPUDRAFT_338374 [Daphnia pulex]